MSLFSKILKALAMILIIAVFVNMFILALRMETDEQKLKSGEILPEESVSGKDIMQTFIKNGFAVLSSLIIAGIAIIFDTTRKVSVKTDDLPDQIPVRDDPMPPTSDSNIIKPKTCNGCVWLNNCGMKAAKINSRCEWYERR